MSSPRRAGLAAASAPEGAPEVCGVGFSARPSGSVGGAGRAVGLCGRCYLVGRRSSDRGSVRPRRPAPRRCSEPWPGRCGCRGPWCVDTVTDRKYRPLAAGGLARWSSSTTARMLATSCSWLNEALPTRMWTLPTLSVRYSTRPPLNSPTALPTSVVTVPGLGVGHEAAGPEDPAERAHLAHQVGGGDGDVEVEEAAVDLGDQVVRTDLVGPGRSGFGGCLAGGEHGHPDRRAGARGQRQRAPDDLVGLAGVDAEADGQLDGLVELGAGQLLHQVDGLAEAVELLAVDLAQAVLVLLPVLGHRPTLFLRVLVSLVRVLFSRGRRLPRRPTRFSRRP